MRQANQRAISKVEMGIGVIISTFGQKWVRNAVRNNSVIGNVDLTENCQKVKM